MSQVINNKIYDASKAERVYTDVKCLIDYYKTSKGNYFTCDATDISKGFSPISKEDFKNVIGKLGVEKFKEIFPNEELEEA